MAQLETAITNPQQQDPPPLRQQSSDLNDRASRQTGAIEAGKETIVHDFLSLCGSKSASSTITAAKIGSQFSVAMQDLPQPLQKAIFPGSGDVLPAGFVLGGSMPHTSSSGDYNAGGQLASYSPVNGGGEMQPNNRSLDFSYVSKAHVPHGISVNKHWQQQRQGVVALEVLDGNKKLARVVSEDEEDEDDDSFDHGYSSKKEVPYQKFDDAQQLEGKSMDSKGLLTPRSKHSATEQRRRSKINDRFQMLRQLLPNSNQKRDKASFLLEVIEYIQMLHDKVKKYEAAELLGQLQERTKASPWDRTSGCKEGVTMVSYGSSVSTQTNNIKEVADTTAYTSYRSSPSRVAHEKGITNLDITSIRGHTSSLPSRVFKAPACLPSYENNFSVSKPTVLSFTPVSNSTEEPATPTLFPTGSQTFPDARSMFFQLLHQEEQAAMRGRTSPYRKEEAIALPQLHQAGRSMVPQLASALLDPDHERLRSSEQSPSMQRDKRPEVVVEQGRSSPVNDMHEMNTGSNSMELDYDEGRTSHGLNSKYNDKLACINLEGSKGDCRDEDLADEQGPPAVLGGVVNISSPYSQGLLDTITQALQSSGVDLAQARMSVQINLGKPNASTFTSSKEMATLNTAKLPVVNKGNNFSQDSEPPTKRRMVEGYPTRG